MFNNCSPMLVVIWALTSACSAHPEVDSGPDGYRDTASQITLGEWVPDQVNTDGDRTDWFSFESDFPDAATAQLLIPDSDGGISIGLYEVHGMLITQTHKPQGVGKNKTVKLQAPIKQGRHYIRVRATDGGTIKYSIRLDIGPVEGIEEPSFSSPSNNSGHESYMELPSE